MRINPHRTAGFLLLTFIFVTGCSDSTTPITIDTLPGTYVLKEVQFGNTFRALPATAEAGPGTNYLAIVSGSLTLRSDATFAISRRFENRRLDETVINGYDIKQSGTYTFTNGHTITFSDVSGDSGTGEVAGSSIYIDFTEGIHRFTR